jgi:selenide,water dikinase
VLRDLPPRPSDPNLLVGTETSDDAGVYRIADDLALVQTVDFFPPLVDDPYVFGQIAAANSLSDVYAMNGRPITALNLVCFPDDELPLSLLAEILRGAADRVARSGAVTVGGHSVRDNEIKFGLSVTGVVDPAEITANRGARPGDALVLTKPLGTGFVTTANKRQECPEDALANAIASMIELNAAGRDAFRAAGGAHAVTDVTGFGLAGHAAEMAEASSVTIHLELAALPLIDGALALAVPRHFNRASKTNRESLAGRIRIAAGVDAVRQEFAFDPQTSGGLLIAVDAGNVERLLDELRSRGAPSARVIGRVEPRQGPTALVLE